MPEDQIAQTVADPNSVDPIVVSSQATGPGLQTTTTEAGSPEPELGRPRDEQGRFVGADPLQTDGAPVEPAAPKFSPQMTDLAHSVQFTDEQINTFNDPSLLWDAIQGRHAQMYRAPAAQQAPPATTSQATGYNNLEPGTQSLEPERPELTLEDFTLELDDTEVAPELAKPVKALAEHVNKLKASLVKQVDGLRAQNAELRASLQNGEARAQQAATQQNAGMWDRIAEEVPGLVQEIGKPSIAMVQTGGPNAMAWGELAPFIAARAQSQRVPEHLIDYQRAAQEGWTAYRAVQNGNGKPSGDPNALPGVAVRASSRATMVPPAQPQRGELTHAQDYEQRDAFMKAAWAAAGGNPFDM